MSEKEIKYRHEYKYVISAAQAAILRVHAHALMQQDSHICKDGPYAGGYNIRSVYFDDFQNTCFWENESGTDPREKFRIRIYNHSDAKISLELKGKRRGMCHKQSCSLTRQQCDALLAGELLPEDPNHPPLLKKFLLQIKTRRLHPVVVVEYDRIPFIYPVGNVRVTLDMNIRGSEQCKDFFSKDLPMRGIMPPGQHILEVKWDELLPDFLYRTLMLDNLQWTSFSKFYLCRKFSGQVKNIGG